MPKAKILIFDIETSPNIAHVWAFYQTNVGAKQLTEDGHMMSFAAKWLGNDKIIYEENRGKNDKALVRKLLKLVNEADLVVAHNGRKFDMGWLRSKAAIHGLKPPSPVKIVDTLLSARKEFYFPRYTLEYLARVFGCTQKLAHKKYPGHELWLECLKGNDEAWGEMKAYNVQDIVALEELYVKMIPWISNHPNLGIYEQEDHAVCKGCASSNLHKRGTYKTNLSIFQRYRCMDCGSWSRGRTNLLDKGKRKELLTNAL